MPTLRIKLPDQGEITHELTADTVSIGRRPDNLIQIVDRSVSAHHAELILEGGHYRLRDLGSTNLTFIDGAAVTDYHLLEPCRIAFGTVPCQFDPFGGSRVETKLSAAQMEKDLAFLRGENADLQGKITFLERQMDILNSARLVTKKSEVTPFATMNDTVRAITSERDDLRHLTAGLKLELEKLREELAATARERDAARQALELHQAERVTHAREMQDLRRQIESQPDRSAEAASPTPLPAPTVVMAAVPQNGLATSPTSATTQPAVTFAASPALADSGTTQRVTLPLPAEFRPVATALTPVRVALELLTADPASTAPRAALIAAGSVLVEATARLDDHPIGRLALAMEALLEEFASNPAAPDVRHIRTLTHAAEVIAHLLDPRCLERARTLPHPKVLAVDDDTDLLQTLAASLELAHLPTTTCADSRQAQALLEKESYDLLLLDVNLPGLDGPALCGQIRDGQHHRNTPVIFLTVANTLDHRAQASLSGGNDFLPKPFNTAELTVKAETWIWKNRFGLL